MGCNYLLRAGADQCNITDLSLSSHPSTHGSYDTSGRREWLIKEAITAKDYKTIMKKNSNTTIGTGLVRNAGKVEESNEEHGAREAGLMETPTCLDGDAVLKIVMGIIMTVMGW